MQDSPPHPPARAGRTALVPITEAARPVAAVPVAAPRRAPALPRGWGTDLRRDVGGGGGLGEVGDAATPHSHSQSHFQTPLKAAADTRPRGADADALFSRAAHGGSLHPDDDHDDHDDGMPASKPGAAASSAHVVLDLSAAAVRPRGASLAGPMSPAPDPTALLLLVKNGFHPLMLMLAMDERLRRLAATTNPFRDRWTLTLFLATLYVLVELPLVFAFQLPFLPWVVFDSAVILVFSADVVFNFYMPFRDEEDEWVTDTRRVRTHYLQTWFVPDLLAALPFDYLVFLATPAPAAAASSALPGAGGDRSMVGALQATRLLKLFRLLRAIKLLDSVNVRGLPAWLQLWFLFTCFFLLAHWIACSMWAIAVAEGLATSFAAAKGLVALPAHLQYLYSLYWAITTVTTLGYGDITPVTPVEVLFASLAIFVGAVFYAVVISALGAHVVSTRFAAKLDYTRFMDKLEALEHNYKLPVAVRKRIHAHYEDAWKRHQAFADKLLVDDLPPLLRRDVASAVLGKLLASSAFVQTCWPDSAFQRALVACMTWEEVRLPGDVLVRQGAPAPGVFFVRAGLLSVTRAVRVPSQAAGLPPLHELVVARRGPGQHVGDESLWSEEALWRAREGGQAPAAAFSVIVAEHAEVFAVSAPALATLLLGHRAEMKAFLAAAALRRQAMLELADMYDVVQADGGLASRRGDGSPAPAPSEDGEEHVHWTRVEGVAEDRAELQHKQHVGGVGKAAPSAPNSAARRRLLADAWSEAIAYGADARGGARFWALRLSAAFDEGLIASAAQSGGGGARCGGHGAVLQELSPDSGDVSLGGSGDGGGDRPRAGRCDKGRSGCCSCAHHGREASFRGRESRASSSSLGSVVAAESEGLDAEVAPGFAEHGHADVWARPAAGWDEEGDGERETAHGMRSELEDSQFLLPRRFRSAIEASVPGMWERGGAAGRGASEASDAVAGEGAAAVLRELRGLKEAVARMERALESRGLGGAALAPEGVAGGE